MSLNTAASGRAAVRVFVLDAKSQPVSGVSLSLFADFSQAVAPPSSTPGAQTARSRPVVPANLTSTSLLATLRTDLAGYASFKFDSRSIAGAQQLRLVPLGVPSQTQVLSVGDILAGRDLHTITFDATGWVPSAPQLGVPSVMAADSTDLAASPASIGLIPQVTASVDLCSQLMPTRVDTKRFSGYQVLADVCQRVVPQCPLDTTIVQGKVLEYAISWESAGTSLGDLLNSITLAPCERVTIAIADWIRRETASQTSSSSAEQQTFQLTDHERLITETMTASVKSTSKTKGWAGSVGASAPVDPTSKINLTAAFGGGVTNNQSTNQTALNTTSQLSDVISQAASFVASERSSVVFQATTSEQNTYQTRIIRNHNHCHTLTLLYYQINRAYKVVTEYTGERDVILVWYDFGLEFDGLRAWQNSLLLKDALLDASLAPNFDALGKALFCCDSPSATIKQRVESFRITLSVIGPPPPGSPAIFLNAQVGGPNWTVPVGFYRDSGTYTFVVAVPSGEVIDPAAITSFTVTSEHSGLISGMTVTYRALGYLQDLPLCTGWNSPAREEIDLPAKAGAPVSENPCVQSSCDSKILLAHLNAYKRYYNGVIALGEDPNERLTRWSCCGAGVTPTLLSQIDNVALTVFGDFVVFPAAGSVLVPDPTVPPSIQLVSLPTPGVYSEGVLGKCNSCEILDPAWQNIPCDDDTLPTAPTPSSGSSVDPANLKADTISNLINLTAAPDVAPGNAMKDLISSLVTNADNGSKEASDLLSKLLDTVKASIPSSDTSKK